jgi:hypothetical protein
MKTIILFAAVTLTSIFASAATLNCQLLKIEGGRVVSESKIVKAEGIVDLSINDFESTYKVVGSVQGDTREDNALQLRIYHTELDVMATAASVKPSTTVELHALGGRYALTCWK